MNRGDECSTSGQDWLRRQDSNPADASSASELERVAATKIVMSSPVANRSHEPKTIETQAACTNVPNRGATIADAIALLRSLTTEQRNARGIRRALLELLAAIDDDE